MGWRRKWSVIQGELNFLFSIFIQLLMTLIPLKSPEKMKQRVISLHFPLL